MTDMKPTPPGWPRLSSTLFYIDAPKMIDWLCEAFDFECRLKVEGDGGVIIHSELEYGEAVVMVSSAPQKGETKFGVPMLSPKMLNGANTQCLMLYVDDVDAHCARARAAGADIRAEPEVHDYGEEYWADKGYGAVDPEGHSWWFAQRMRNPDKP